MRGSQGQYARRREALIDELRSKGITDERVLVAMGAVEREQFVPEPFKNRAYEDKALPIGFRQTISQPYTVAYQSSLLESQPGDKVLEIGTGSGYQAAVLCEMGLQVYSIERLAALHKSANAVLEKLGYRAITRCGDGTLGWTLCAPFNAILVTAGGTEVPGALKNQLRVPEAGQRGGRLIIPVGDRSGQEMTIIERTGEDSFKSEVSESFLFVPLVAGRA